MIIAIDGYSSCGKSTVAKAIARKLGLAYIDSGAMYRSVTYFFLENNILIPLPHELESSHFNYENVLQEIEIQFRIDKATNLSEIYLNNEKVEDKIRSMIVSENVSHVSAIKAVRKKMVALQQKMSEYGNLVMDGRDIGTTVFPNADLKIFMTADPMVRAKRRYDELKRKGIDLTMEDVIANINSRDEEDSHRLESPLRKAPDAIILDNTFMNEREQVDFVLAQIEKLRISVKNE